MRDHQLLYQLGILQCIRHNTTQYGVCVPAADSLPLARPARSCGRRRQPAQQQPPSSSQPRHPHLRQRQHQQHLLPSSWLQHQQLHPPQPSRKRPRRAASLLGLGGRRSRVGRHAMGGGAPTCSLVSQALCITRETVERNLHVSARLQCTCRWFWWLVYRVHSSRCMHAGALLI